jgi:hypothetical protein
MKLTTFAAAALIAAANASAQVQTQIGVPPVLEVQRLAPQLIAFAGGEVNFANLVNGLALGLPITLTTPLGVGVTQVVSFTPAGTMSALQIAQTLEAARQSLISRGIATPTAQQVGVALVGGLLPTALGGIQVSALVRSSTVLATNTVTQPSAAALLQTPAAAGGTVRNTSDSVLPRGISDTPQTLVPGVTTATPPPVAVNPARPNSPFISGAPAAAGGTVPPFGAPR